MPIPNRARDARTNANENESTTEQTRRSERLHTGLRTLDAHATAVEVRRANHVFVGANPEWVPSPPPGFEDRDRGRTVSDVASCTITVECRASATGTFVVESHRGGESR